MLLSHKKVIQPTLQVSMQSRVRKREFFQMHVHMQNDLHTKVFPSLFHLTQPPGMNPGSYSSKLFPSKLFLFVRRYSDGVDNLHMHSRPINLCLWSLKINFSAEKPRFLKQKRKLNAISNDG
jgi:hypothetical protein